ncbi:MAG TPA: hypothetical protein VN253_23795 [Kofleriaceae bacterium]|nr:hypothetical protein [Kofleriaceae bacterium]
MRYWTAFGASLLLWIGHGVAWGQTAADKAAAAALFADGQKAISAGDIEAACAKFEASLAKVTQLGTQLALASCYEKLGKTASAYGEFRAAAGAARKAHDMQRQVFAEQHATALEGRLSKLVVKLEPGYRIDGLEVKRDGMALMPAELGSAVPVDPGEHVIEGSAPGWTPYSYKVTVPPEPGTVEVIVPALGKAPVRVEEPKAEPKVMVQQPAPEQRTRRRYLAYGLGGGGIAVVGASLIIGAVASSRWGDVRSHCRDNICDQSGVDLANSARTMGNVSTATFVVGAAALATGVYLFLTSRPPAVERPPAASSTALRVVPGVGSTQLGLTLQGGF